MAKFKKGNLVKLDENERFCTICDNSNISPYAVYIKYSRLQKFYYLKLSCGCIESGVEGDAFSSTNDMEKILYG